MHYIQAVFFDLYETVVTEFDPHWKPVPTTAERLGLTQECFAVEWRARQQQRMNGAHADYRSVLREICRATVRPIDEALIEQLHAERLAAKALPFAHIEDDIVTALAAIRRLGVKVGLISNCTAEEVAPWERSALRALFDDAVLSFQVGYAKPARQIYLLACQRLEVQPGRSIFVGDGGSDELAGAASAGMTAYQATWFLARWPTWKIAGRSPAQARYPRLQTPSEVIAIVEADGSTTSW